MVPEKLYAILRRPPEASEAGGEKSHGNASAPAGSAARGEAAPGGESPSGEVAHSGDLLAPAVGLFRGHLPPGAGVVPEQQIGTMLILDRVVPLLAPPGAAGQVVGCALEPGLHPVEYHQELYRLGRAAAADLPGTTADSASATEARRGQVEVRSPTDGVFYRRSDPQSPPYVEVGEVVEPGHTLGLVEVMKCFNQVRFAGTNLPARARVLSIAAGDSEEIRFDQVLFVLEPLE